MTMTGRIEPALTKEEWATLREQVCSNEGVAAWLDECYQPDEVGAVRIIAAMNYRLPDSDPRKITRARVDALREVAREIDAENKGMITQCGWADDFLNGLADALESYLPPE
jgi:hypothetical protein